MPKPECSCKQHSQFSIGKEFNVYKRSSRKISKQLDDILVENGFLSERAVYLCTACGDYAYENFVVLPKEKRAKHANHYVDTLVDLIDTGAISDGELMKLLVSIGKRSRDSVIRDSKLASREYSDDKFLDDYDPLEWLQSRNKVIVEFLKSICGIDSFEGNKRKLLSFVKMYEHLLLCCTDNAIFPLSFVTNLISYFSTGSKTISEINNAMSPCGSYSTILSWIAERSVNENTLPPHNDVFTFFDNNQVLSRNWRVTFDYKSTASVVTNILHIFPQSLTDLQTKPELSPSSWLYKRTRSENVLLVSNLQTQADIIFRRYRKEFISDQISSILSEKDLVQANITSSSTLYLNRNTNKAADKYSFLTDSVSVKPSALVLGDPVMRNPCSYSAVKHVLGSIQTTVCKEREWTVAGCDGSPYVLASRLMEKQYKCRVCQNEFSSKISFQSHIVDIHAINNIEHEVETSKTYGNLLLIPGLGHIEINMIKGIFKLLWPVYLKDLALMLGFRTIRAQTCCQNATDHHKAMQILEIALFALSSELIFQYCSFCKHHNKEPSVEGYFYFLTTVKNDNYLFANETVFTYMLSIYLFRASVRRNHSDLLLACRIKFAPIFYGMNMTHYQEIHFRDCIMRVNMPDDLKCFINNNESFSCSGHPSKGEGGDFILEAKNRRTKMWMPPGTPTESRWYRVCRNQDRLEKVHACEK